MGLLLKDRDYVDDGNGGISMTSDGDEVLGEVLFRLAARRGSFPFLPGLGSRMHLLRRAKPSEWEGLALQYAVEALEEMGDVAVMGVEICQEGDALWTNVGLLWQGTRLSVTAQLEG